MHHKMWCIWICTTMWCICGAKCGAQGTKSAPPQSLPWDINFRMILAPSGEEVRLSYMPVSKLNRMVQGRRWLNQNFCSKKTTYLISKNLFYFIMHPIPFPLLKNMNVWWTHLRKTDSSNLSKNQCIFPKNNVFWDGTLDPIFSIIKVILLIKFMIYLWCRWQTEGLMYYRLFIPFSYSPSINTGLTGSN